LRDVNWMRLVEKLKWLPPGLIMVLEHRLKRIPGVRTQIDREMDEMLAELGETLKPYRQALPSFDRLPRRGLPSQQILEMLTEMRGHETDAWQDGFVSGAVYHGAEGHVDLLNQAYALHSQSNPLHSDVWPSATKFEAEIVAMTAHMLGAAQADEPVVGAVTSGGTESILLAMLAHRDWARETKGVSRPEVILPVTAHAAFDKAAHYFGIKLVKVPVTGAFTVDVEAVRRAINRRTILLVGSAPTFPHGVIDPIAALSGLALAHGIGFHTDACLGGFVLPWAERLGYPVPPFDFRLPGVTSISADTHKYGYAAKGSSVVLYRGRALRRHQYFTATEWPGGLYYSPTLAGSRPGGLSAACWAGMISVGEEGYLTAVRTILETAATLRQGIAAMPELRLLGDALWVLAFTADEPDIYLIAGAMAERGWILNGLQHPPAVHLAVTLRHAQTGVAARFLNDLRQSIDFVREKPEAARRIAPIYGMAATFPARGLVREMLEAYVDFLYEV
jgi:glutamate/tyrosine decarboxylase-like PLP-dependent enzyme